MTKREAKRVALVIAARALDGFIDSGALYSDTLDDQDVERITTEIRAIADSLDERGRRRDGVVLTLKDAIKVAGVK